MGATTRSVQLCGWFLELASRLVCGQEGMVLPAHEQGLSDCRRLCVDCVRITSWKRVPARVRVPFVTCSPQCMVCFPRGPYDVDIKFWEEISSTFPELAPHIKKRLEQERAAKSQV